MYTCKLKTIYPVDEQEVWCIDLYVYPCVKLKSKLSKTLETFAMYIKIRMVGLLNI